MAEVNWVYSPSGIAYNWQFQPEAYSEQFARNGNQISNLLVTRWEDAGSLKADLMESAEYVAGQAWLKRTLPLQCPEADALYLSEMVKAKTYMPKTDDTGYGTQTRDDATGWWSLDGGRIAYLCTFRTFPYLMKKDADVRSLTNPELNRFCTVTPQTLVSNRTVTGTKFCLEDTPSVFINETAAIPESLTRFLVRQWMWPKAAINWDVIRDRQNKVNNATFTVYGINCAAESLAYEGLAGSPEEYTGPDGKRYVDITHSLLLHPNNWNKTLWPTPPGGLDWKYVKLTDPAGGPAFVPAVRRYRTASFTEIFNPL